MQYVYLLVSRSYALHLQYIFFLSIIQICANGASLRSVTSFSRGEPTFIFGAALNVNIHTLLSHGNTHTHAHTYTKSLRIFATADDASRGWWLRVHSKCAQNLPNDLLQTWTQYMYMHPLPPSTTMTTTTTMMHGCSIAAGAIHLPPPCSVAALRVSFRGGCWWGG